MRTLESRRCKPYHNRVGLIRHMEMSVQQADDRPQVVSDVVRRRARPYVIVLNSDLQIVCAERRALEFLSQIYALGGTSRDLPVDVHSAIDAMMKSPDFLAEASEQGVLLAVGMLLLRIVAMSGDGQSYISVFVEPQAKREFLQHATERYALTKRETEVLALTVRGHRSSAIAKELCIAPATVNDHFKSLLKKTDTRSRSEMLAKIFGSQPP